MEKRKGRKLVNLKGFLHWLINCSRRKKTKNKWLLANEVFRTEIEENRVDQLTLIHQSFELLDSFLRMDTHSVDLKKKRKNTKDKCNLPKFLLLSLSLCKTPNWSLKTSFNTRMMKLDEYWIQEPLLEEESDKKMNLRSRKSQSLEAKLQFKYY